MKTIAWVVWYIGSALAYVGDSLRNKALDWGHIDG
jgi:hypothetical protein